MRCSAAPWWLLPKATLKGLSQSSRFFSQVQSGFEVASSKAPLKKTKHIITSTNHSLMWEVDTDLWLMKKDKHISGASMFQYISWHTFVLMSNFFFNKENGAKGMWFFIHNWHQFDMYYSPLFTTFYFILFDSKYSLIWGGEDWP